MLSGHAKRIIVNDHEFLEKVKKLSAKYQINPADLLGKIASESGFNPAADNGTCWIDSVSKDSAAAVGTTQTALKKMTVLSRWIMLRSILITGSCLACICWSSLYSYYLPFASKPANYVLASVVDLLIVGDITSSWYDHNAGLNIDGDGQITMADLGQGYKKRKRWQL